jgi:hypothetical protein
MLRQVAVAPSLFKLKKETKKKTNRKGENIK